MLLRNLLPPILFGQASMLMSVVELAHVSQCQRAKINKHTSAPLSSFPISNARFDVVDIDLVGPLPSSQGYSYFLTCVD